MLDPVFPLIARACTALLFAGALWHKLRDLDAFRRALAGYELLPAGLVPVAALLLAGAEGLALLCLVWWPAPGALLAAALLALYALAIAANLLRGRRDVDCGCGGRGVGLSWLQVARNLVLVVVAWVAGLSAAPRSLTWLDVLTVVAASLGLAALYLALDQALRLRVAAAAAAGERPLWAP